MNIGFLKRESDLSESRNFYSNWHIHLIAPMYSIVGPRSSPIAQTVSHKILWKALYSSITTTMKKSWDPMNAFLVKQNRKHWFFTFKLRNQGRQHSDHWSESSSIPSTEMKAKVLRMKPGRVDYNNWQKPMTFPTAHFEWIGTLIIIIIIPTPAYVYNQEYKHLITTWTHFEKLNEQNDWTLADVADLFDVTLRYFFCGILDTCRW